MEDNHSIPDFDFVNKLWDLKVKKALFILNKKIGRNGITFELNEH